MKKTSKGFTLVELLVVIAVIGILAGVILVSLNSARGKAQDVKIISDVKQLKNTFESNYSGVAYPDLTNDNPVYGGLVADGNPGTSTITVLLADILAQGSTLNIVNDPNTGPTVLSYAIYGQLVSSSTQYFCLDSVGGTNEETSTNTSVTCPQ
jgi:prepilin-type N-terminal cleavage/methylation domain-containing protein